MGDLDSGRGSVILVVLGICSAGDWSPWCWVVCSGFTMFLGSVMGGAGHSFWLE